MLAGEELGRRPRVVVRSRVGGGDPFLESVGDLQLALPQSLGCPLFVTTRLRSRHAAQQRFACWRVAYSVRVGQPPSATIRVAETRQREVSQRS